MSVEACRKNESDLSPGPVLAFLFLTKGDLNLPDVWKEFFEEAGEKLPVFLHVKDPSLVASEVLTSAFHVPTIPTRWGDISLVRATLRLLDYALKNSAATHFALVSESCVPIKSWQAMKLRLAMDERSRIGWQLRADMKETHRGRCRTMPEGYAEIWHFQHQWMILSRNHAEIALAHDDTAVWEKCFAPDEHYFITHFVQMGMNLQQEIRNITPTWVDWQGSKLSHWSHVDESLALILMDSPAFFARKMVIGSDIGRWNLHRDDRSRPALAHPSWYNRQEFYPAQGSLRIHVLPVMGGSQMKTASQATWANNVMEGIECVFHRATREEILPHEGNVIHVPQGSDLWDACEHLAREEAHCDGPDWVFFCSDLTYVCIPRLLTLRGGGKDCILPDADIHASDSLMAGFLVKRSFLHRLRACYGADFCLRRDMAMAGVNLLVTAALAPKTKPAPRWDNMTVTGYCRNMEWMHAMHAVMNHEPLHCVKVQNLTWSDELLFYEGGFFSRKAGTCMGRYRQIAEYCMELQWFAWGKESIEDFRLDDHDERSIYQLRKSE